MERSALGFPDLSGAGQTTGNRNPFHAGQAEPPRKTGPGDFQPGTRVAGGDGPARGGTPAPAPAANDDTQRQRTWAAWTDSASPAQSEEIQHRPRQDRLPA